LFSFAFLIKKTNIPKLEHFENHLPKHLPGNVAKKQGISSMTSQIQHTQNKEEEGATNVAGGGGSIVKPSKVYGALATQAEFEAIPSSTRLRCTLDEINSILSSIQLIVSDKEEKKKASGAKKPSKTITITEDELTSIPVLKKSLGGKTRALVHTLRALGRLKSSIKEGKSMYIVVASD
jgi:hypothetical protein